MWVQFEKKSILIKCGTLYFLSVFCIIRFILTYALPDLPVSLYLHRQLRPWSVTTRKYCYACKTFNVKTWKYFKKERVIDLVREKRKSGGTSSGNYSSQRRLLFVKCDLIGWGCIMSVSIFSFHFEVFIKIPGLMKWRYEWKHTWVSEDV